jgi:hypothetical protein
MPSLAKIAIGFVLAIIAFVIGNSLVTTLGASSRWLIILAVVIFYIAWWNLRRRPPK